MLLRNLPLAWFQLSHQRARFAIATLGITFALLLIFIQLGLQAALYESNTGLQRHLRGDLVMLHDQTSALVTTTRFSRRRLYQALNIDGVEAVTPIYYRYHTLKNIDEARSRDLAIFGINPQASPFDFPDLDQNLTQLNLTDAVLFDRGSSPEYGNFVDPLDANQPVRAEVAGQRVQFVGAIDFIGTSFAFDGNVVTSDYTFFRIFPELNPENISIGVITLASGAQRDPIIARLRQQLPADLKVVTVEDYITLEENYWRETTPIGFIFSMGVGVGFIVGVIIVYQILYAEISDHIPDYAILKARGYRGRYFIKLIMQAAVLLSIAGYIPGFLLSSLMYKAIGQATQLPLYMTWERALWVFGLSTLMCIVSGVVAMRKLADVDPAELL
ncbi:MAG: ABC transporter permease DevC [Cyanobacteria bacterium P01_H01_bin.121]